MPTKLPPFYTRIRFATSAVATWLLNLNIFGFARRNICSPGFNCHGCAWATAACPVGAIAYGSAMHVIPVFAIASVLAVGALLGRLVCSFACPFGLFQDLLYRIPTPKLRLPRFVRYGKYAALLLLVLAFPYFLGFAPAGYLQVNKPEVNKGEGASLDVKVSIQNLGTEPVLAPQIKVAYKDKQTAEEVFTEKKDYPDVTVPPGETIFLPNFQVPNQLSTADLVLDSPQSVVTQKARYQLYYCYLCPAGTLTASIPSYFASGSAPLMQRIRAHWLRLSILLAFLVFMILSSRPFCRVFCPLGAAYALSAPLAVSRMSINHDACIDCGLCNRACPMSLDVRKEVGGAECIACGDCKKVCPKHGIKRTFGL